MPNKINRITKIQAARFGEWAEKWIAIGLSTEPADFDRATAAAFRAYKAANLNRPMVTLRVGSPYAATLGGALAWAMLREIFGNKKITKQVELQVWSQVEPHVQPYMKLNALAKRPHVRFDWSEKRLTDLARWANRYLWKYCAFDEYVSGIRTSRAVPAGTLFEGAA